MAKKRPFINRLNDLTTKEWIRFQKSWFVHNPPPRRKDVLRHPAKFPETLAQEFIEFFTKKGQLVFDPMVGTGSTILASMRSGRNSIGIELHPDYVDIARTLIAAETEKLGAAVEGLRAEVIQADAADIPDLELPEVDYVLTSPPYWNMLHAAGAETQRKRRAQAELDVVYSENPADLGNIDDYELFLNRLVAVYRSVQDRMRSGAYMTVIVKNVKKGGVIYPLAWDLADRLRDFLVLKDERIWLQDNIRLAPYGMGNAWVSNTFHHYCLQFRNDKQ